MAARAVVRDVARVQDKPFGLADRLSKMIPAEVGMTLAKAIEQEQDLADFIARNEDAQESWTWPKSWRARSATSASMPGAW